MSGKCLGNDLEGTQTLLLNPNEDVKLKNVNL